MRLYSVLISFYTICAIVSASAVRDNKKPEVKAKVAESLKRQVVGGSSVPKGLATEAWEPAKPAKGTVTDRGSVSSRAAKGVSFVRPANSGGTLLKATERGSTSPSGSLGGMANSTPKQTRVPNAVAGPELTHWATDGASESARDSLLETAAKNVGKAATRSTAMGVVKNVGTDALIGAGVNVGSRYVKKKLGGDSSVAGQLGGYAIEEAPVAADLAQGRMDKALVGQAQVTGKKMAEVYKETKGLKKDVDAETKSAIDYAAEVKKVVKEKQQRHEPKKGSPPVNKQR